MKFLNQAVNAVLPAIPKPIMWMFARRYIAGKNLEDVTRVVRSLNQKKIMATVDVLGEDVAHRDETIFFRTKCIETLATIQQTSIDANISVKLTQLGLKLDVGLCEENLRAILTKANEHGYFTRIDMEDHTCTDATLKIYRSVIKDFPKTGIVIQAYLRRSEDDIKQIIADNGNVRLCKGIYIEPESIAFKRREEIQENFKKLLAMMFAAKIYVGIATHDYVLLDAAHSLIRQYQLQKSEYEFQMLLGVREDLRDKIVTHKDRIRIYVPYGEHWHKYSIRRFKENPEIAGYVFKAIFGMKDGH